MTVKEFMIKTVDSYMALAVNEYDGDKNVRRFIFDPHKWNWQDLPEDIQNKEVSSIVPYYSRISVEVETTR